jgi:antitoxin (DNA-binding transcriptional repressor) of toxin-antitoxin stability system
MRKVDIHETKTTLWQLVEAAEAGETVVLARAGNPVVKLVRLTMKRGIGLSELKGQIPEQLIQDIAKPLLKTDIEALFSSNSDRRPADK